MVAVKESKVCRTSSGISDIRTRYGFFLPFCLWMLQSVLTNHTIKVDHDKANLLNILGSYSTSRCLRRALRVFFFCPPQIERNLHSFPIEPLMHLMNLRRMELVRLSCPSNWLTEQLYDLDDFRAQWPIRSMNIGGFRVGCVCLRQLTSPSWWGIFLDQWESPSRIEIGRSIERWIAV